MPTIAIIGGTGPEGRGLGLRFAMAGHKVILGSRDPQRAAQAATDVTGLHNEADVSGAANAEAAGRADLVLLSIPYEGLASTVEGLAPSLAGKVVISVVTALSFERGQAQTVVVPEGSAAEQVARLLPSSQVVAAFHHLSAPDLLVPDRQLEGDVIVCGDVLEAKEAVIKLAEVIESVRALDGGPLGNSRYLEGLTALLLSINRRYKLRSYIRVLGL